MKWYSYLWPRRVIISEHTFWRWLNFIIMFYPHTLQWELIDEDSGRYMAIVPLSDKKYFIWPTYQNGDNDKLYWAFMGPNVEVGYRRTLERAIKTCQDHYTRTHLGHKGRQ